MKILELQASNVKRLRAVEIKPDGATVVIGGANGAGKSSVLDSIIYALGGVRGMPSKPIRNGEKSANVTITLDKDADTKLIVTRRFSDDGKSTLEVKQVDDHGVAMKVASPQKLLDSLCSAVAFDPLAFTRMRPQDQVETLRKVLGVDVSDLDGQINETYDERTNTNRGLRTANEMLATLPFHEDAPDAEVSISDLVSKLNEAQAVNRAKYEAQQDVGRIELAIAEKAKDAKSAYIQVEGLRQKLAEAEQLLAEIDQDRKGLQAQRDKAQIAAGTMPEVECDPIHQEIEQAESVSAKVRENQKRAEGAKVAAEYTAKAEALTDKLDALRAERIERLADAEWPVEGLSFGEHGVVFNDLPFEQCSSAEQLRISTAIGLAQHPTLRVMLIHDGSLLDDQSLAAVAEMAAENDAQVWIERVGDGAECSVVIEDGAVVQEAELATA